ncbi:helix-turn-helix transcriptional regulator [Liquorilactobacillus satsumensis]|nr:helix-turn-helix domain-containing protein [Liquorilactobacillus satsumensis]MCC7667743.1 transcriptional regulator [Liquorilactobacillus satsumensis]MCP9311926.1 helix-turn-helix transcriptional regulator [Liquorilactobacillus satsumensis]MCP9328600.1 helix-turn-helix transcriptional regulator [Liquorilactobacillus satsumensis]MCP9356926.1 helix-turn-helix transcriptional regulator [Liquorilactobacillus satsumensis]MCP9359059.1 helix-turn-helix transcriptional regulator [Liquorilactobacill
MQSTSNWSCGVASVMDIFGGKWKLNILWRISQHEGLGFNQLKREVEGITNIMLTRAIKTLVAENLIIRKELKVTPPRTEYYLTASAKSLLPIMAALNEWGKDNL